MEVLRYTGYSIAVAAVAIAAAIQYLPDYHFMNYVVEVLALGVIASLAVVGLSFYRQDDLTMHDKNVLMSLMMVAVLAPTFYTVGAFIHESQTSWSSGEIHWHADFEVIVQDSPQNLGFQPSENYKPPSDRCKGTNGEYLCHLNLIDPGNYCQQYSKESTYMCRINDRVGITEYHEHNDKRIHLEGTFDSRDEATLSAFFETFEGKLSGGELVFPTNNGIYRSREGDGKTVKVAVKKGVGGSRGWALVNPEEYVISSFTQENRQIDVLLDDIFIIYDGRSGEQVLQDLKNDDRYRGMEFFKSGEGYDG